MITIEPLHPTIGAAVQGVNLARVKPEEFSALKQAFLNIIINGFQAMEQGGRLLVSTTRENETDVLISIKDHGTGIEPEARERIFHLYYTTKPDGNGIGLAQAFRAVQLHNGQITFDSQPGLGTTFHIRLKAVMSAED